MSRCGYCEEKLGSQNDYVQCGKCKAKYHYDACSGLSSNSWRAKEQRKRGEWSCDRCRKLGHDGINQEETPNEEEDETEEEVQIQNAAEGEIPSILKALTRMEKKLDELTKIKQEMKEIKDSMNFLNQKYQAVLEENQEM